MTKFKAPSPAASMYAAVLHERGPEARVRLERRPVPHPARGEVLVRVAAAGVNPRDWMIRAGIYPFRIALPRGPFVMGSDFAGTVVAVGDGVSGLSPGARVFGMPRSFGTFGAFAEYIAVRRDLVALTPERLDDTQAAAIPLAALTAWQALFRCARLRPGDRVLITGASGGVGAYAAQLAAATGAHVTGVCSASNMPFVSALGAARTLDYRQPGFITGHGTWDVVFDAAGRWTYRWFRPHMPAGGRYVTTVPRVADIGAALLSPLSRRLRPGRPTAALVLVRAGGEPLRDIAARAADGRLEPHIDTIYPLEEINRALDHSRTMHTRGKLVVRVAGAPDPASDASPDQSPGQSPETSTDTSSVPPSGPPPGAAAQ